MWLRPKQRSKTPPTQPTGWSVTTKNRPAGMGTERLSVANAVQQRGRAEGRGQPPSLCVSLSPRIFHTRGGDPTTHGDMERYEVTSSHDCLTITSLSVITRLTARTDT